MRVFSSDNHGNLTTVEGFFRGAVQLERLGLDAGAMVRASRVTFEAGARTVWHSHSGGQVLVFLGDGGVVGTRGQTVPVRPGDVVWTDAGEEHWHGAADGHAASHVAISFGETRWDDRV